MTLSSRKCLTVDKSVAIIGVDNRKTLSNDKVFVVRVDRQRPQNCNCLWFLLSHSMPWCLIFEW